LLEGVHLGFADDKHDYLEPSEVVAGDAPSEAPDRRSRIDSLRRGGADDLTPRLPRAQPGGPLLRKRSHPWPGRRDPPLAAIPITTRSVIVLVIDIVIVIDLAIALALVLVVVLVLVLVLVLVIVIVLVLVIALALALVLVIDDCSPNASTGAARKAWQGPEPEELSERSPPSRER
jgi:hypothetical protein